ncbi:hypothetical protein N1851_034359 [Merluccius polli]|uniref:C2H2-type domain-containing protein n=1 Tax=Merluccius polli TaxID=89951 RepID=A0AA47LZP2_MERPO|nr:hypothetical protein N1851_034359 [Merluccius polli]
MKCRFCSFASASRERLLRHHRLRHGRGAYWPCVYSDCEHLTKTAFNSDKVGATDAPYLGRHFKNHETVCCPFLRCSFKTNNLKTFSSHKSRKHKHDDIRTCLRADLEKEPVSETDASDQPLGSEEETLPSSSRNSDVPEKEEYVDAETLEHRAAGLFLRMQTELHVSRHAVQKIVEGFNDIFHFSKSHSQQGIKAVLAEHGIELDDGVLRKINDAVFETNPLIISTEGKGALATDHRRNLYFKDKFPVIQPTEYTYERTHKQTFVYVSIIQVLETLLRQPDFAEKLVFSQGDNSGTFFSFRDGHYYRDNGLLGVQDASISIGLYIDDLELCNPLGSSKKIHKITAVYWVLLNLPSKFRSTLPLIQLACLGKTVDVRQFGYDAFLYPLIRDLGFLETVGVYIEALDTFVKGTVFCVCADNLGFQEAFNVEKFCRFCCISRDQIGNYEPRNFPLRTVMQHDSFVEQLKLSDKPKPCVNGVRSSCVLSKLSFFHPVTGFPPDLLHDLFEGVVPVELCLCLKELIRKGFITFDGLNNRIKQFPYKFSDLVNKPPPITKSSLASGKVKGNGHENWALLRLLPLLIGNYVPEQEPSWEILMDLKEIVEIIVSTTLSEGTLCYLGNKLSEHRQLLTGTFPAFKLKPKQHFIDHYVHLTRCFGPLVDLWTFRFESKHSFFKQAINDARCFKNVLLTLSTKHQQLMAYLLDTQQLFKPKLHIGSVDRVKISSLDEKLRTVLEKKYPNEDTVSLAKEVHLYGTKYVRDMIVSAGECSGLPEFFRILHILVDKWWKVYFVTTRLSSWYMEHYRSYQLIGNCNSDLEILDPETLNDYQPLAAYQVARTLMVTPRAWLLQ